MPAADILAEERISLTCLIRHPHKEYIFCSYPAKVLPSDQATPFDLNNRVCLEYYNLKKTFEGSIKLVKEKKGSLSQQNLKNC